jgi:hypothetical protein
MTHGDQAKAKTAKSNKASAKKSNGKSAVQVSQSGKVSGKKAVEGTKSGKAAAKETGSEKEGRRPSPPQVATAKESGTGTKGAKGRAAASPDDATGFSNAAVAAAFKHAVKKYPNAFRKLTD